MILKLLLGASLAALCAGHVRFTFPPARIYDVDFLDTFRTDGACGMLSNPGSPLTTFSPGQVVNVTWHLAYSHKGGHRLQLLDPTNDNVVYDLTPPNQWMSQDDTTNTMWEVMIPSDASGVYTMRLQREAAEWQRGYFFKSCADIEVKAGSTCNTNSQCSGNGVCRNGMCECDRLASGEFCQYVDHCDSPFDCNNNGECTMVSRTTYPRTQCFCNSGYFGQKCEKKNPDGFSMEVKTSQYNELKLNGDSGDFNLYYKIIEDIGEIEVVMDIKGSTWMAVGWRPDSMDANCKNWPVPYRVGGGGNSHGEPEPEGSSEPEAESSPEPESTPEAEAEAESTPEAEAEAESTPEAEATAETTSEPTRKRRRKRAATLNIINAVLPPNYSSSWSCTSQDGSGSQEGGSSEPEGSPEPETSAEPEGSPEPETSAEPEGSPEPETSAEPEGSPEPETSAEPEGSPEPETSAEPEGSPEPETSAEPEGSPEPETSAEPEGSPEPETSAEPEGSPEPETSAEPEGSPEPETSAEPEGSPEPETSAEPEGSPEPETSAEPEGSAEPETSPEPTGASEPDAPPPAGRPHAMACTDIVIGKVHGSTSHIADYYTRDRATPRLDTFWGGMDDITAAAGIQYAGDRTRFIFRKKLNAMESEMTDHSIEKDNPMHVIWAHGQEYCHYGHRPQSGIEAGSAKDMLFYPRYELKYHGTSNMNRGQIRGLVMYSDQEPGTGEGPCGGELKLPADCMGEDCDYKVSYTFNSATKKITFTVQSKVMPNYWAGVGFSKSGGMIGADAVLSWANAQGVYEVKDMFLKGKGTNMVVQDASQDLTDTEASYENGWLTMKFTRAQNTGDEAEDLPLDADNCVYLLMPKSGGKVSNKQQVLKHTNTPNLSSAKVCIQSCDTVMTTPAAGDSSASAVTASVLMILFAMIIAALNRE